MEKCKHPRSGLYFQEHGGTNDTDESHERAEWRPGRKKCMVLSDFIYMKLNCKQNRSVLLEVRREGCL